MPRQIINCTVQLKYKLYHASAPIPHTPIPAAYSKKQQLYNTAMLAVVSDVDLRFFLSTR